MKYIIGIDGGGTKTDCAAADLQGNILYRTKGNPSNFLVEGTEKASNAILDLVNDCKNNLNCSYDDIEIILIGTAGAGRRSDAERLKESFLGYSQNQGINFNKFEVESDSRIALEGAFSGKPGMILIAGTGSIIFGKDSDGNIHRAGGFGRLIGDEGSGYSLGRKGLNAVSRYFDGRGTLTLIVNMIKEKFQITSSEDLIINIYKDNFKIASVAPIVISAAEMKDEIALKIIKEEINELLLHIAALMKKISLPEIDLCLIGGLIENENFYSEMLKNKIKKVFIEIKIKPAENTPASGAVLMAKELLKKG